jgi:hypothetical protein
MQAVASRFDTSWMWVVVLRLLRCYQCGSTAMEVTCRSAAAGLQPVHWC